MTSVARPPAAPLRARAGAAALDEREFAPELRAIERARRLSPQLRVLACVHTLLGLAALALALIASVILGAAAVFARDVPNEALAVGGGIVGALALLGAPWLALGFGLRRRARWSRALGLVCGALLLPFAPLGTLLGIWTLVVMLGWNPALSEFAVTG